MKVKHRNVMLPIDRLRPHPDNPRKDIGDITELAESIKANGIFQNLTVLFDIDEEEDLYTVIIGHRRLAAAKLAGLTEVPCMVVEMDEKEQISTMLLENMQRSDLTIYEQAQGFQMMLDLGETQDSISKKTGFSKTTVRHRLKLLELDFEELRKAEERQITISDMIELERITDPKLKNEALKQAGTNNFQFAVRKALDEEKHRETVKKWRMFFLELGNEIPYSEKTSKRQLMSYYISDQLDKQKVNIRKLAVDNKPVYFCFDQYNYIYLLAKPNPDSPSPNDAREKFKREQEAKARRINQIQEVENRAAGLRKKFCKSYPGKEKDMPALLTALFADPDRFVIEPDFSAMAKFFSIDTTPQNEDEEEQGEIEILLTHPKYLRHLRCEPQRVMLAWLYADNENRFFKLHDWNGYYKKCEHLERWYELLVQLGYRMSDEEKALLDGTHECFKDGDS